MVTREDLVYRYILEFADHATQPHLRATRQREAALRKEQRELAAQTRAANRAGAATATAARRGAEATTRSTTATRQHTTAANQSSAAIRRHGQAWGSAASQVTRGGRAINGTTRALEREAAAAGHAVRGIQRVEQSHASAARAADRSARAERRAATARQRQTQDARRTAGNMFASGRSAAGFAGFLGAAGVGRSTIEFDKSMRNVNSLAQLSEKNLQKLGDRVRELGGRTAQQPKVLADGLYDLIGSGFKAEDAMRILEQSAKGATAGLTTAEVSTASVAAVLNAYHLPASKAGEVTDTLFKTVDSGVVSFNQLAETIGDVLPFASSLGVDLNQVGASVATMTKAGISAPETMTRIKAVMTAMLKPSEALSKTLKDQGYESGEALIKAKGFQGALDLLAKTTGGSKEELAKLFPNVRALGGALALTGKNSKGANADLKDLQKSAGATDKALSQQSKSTSYQWERLKANASDIAIAIGNEALPAINDAMSGLIKFGSEHPNIAKVAGAIVGVGVALKALKFTKALLGFDDMAKAARDLSKSRFGSAIASQIAAAVPGFGKKGTKGAPGTAYVDPKRGPQAPAPVVAGTPGRASSALGRAGILGAVIGGGLMIGEDVRRGYQQGGLRGAVSRVPVAGAAFSAADNLRRGNLGGAARAAAGAGHPLAAAAGVIDRQVLGGAGGRALSGIGNTVGKALSGVPSAATRAFSGVTRTIGRLPGQIGRTFAQIPRLATRAFSTLGRAAGTAVTNAGRAVLRLPGLAGRVIPQMARWAGRIVGFIATLPIRSAATMVRFGATLARGAVNAGKSLYTRFSRAADDVYGWLRRLPGRAATFISALPGRVSRVATRGGRAVLTGFRSGASAVFTFARSVPGRVATFLGGLAGRVSRLASRGGRSLGSGMRDGAKGLWEWLKGIPGRVVRGIGDLGAGLYRKAKQAGSEFRKGLKEGVGDSLPFDPTPGFNLGILGERRGGLIPRLRRGGAVAMSSLAFAAGGMVPVAVSPGELAILPDGRQWQVPGARTGADSVRTALPGGTAVITGHGQQLMRAGASVDEALTYQRPHFARGGVVGASVYGYGEAGTGTKGYRGDYLPGKMAYAELEMGRALGGLPHKAPLKITYKGRSVKAYKMDIGRGGGYVQGKKRAIDLWKDTAEAIRFPRGLGLVRLGDAKGMKGGTTSERGRTGDTKVRLPDKLTFAGSLPSRAAAWSAGYQSSPGPLGSAIGDIVTGATAQLERRYKTISDSAASRSRGGDESVSGSLRQRIVQAARNIDRKKYPYRWGGGHGVTPIRPTHGAPGGPHRGPQAGYDCSGAIGALLQNARVPGAPRQALHSSGYAGVGRRGPGKFLTIHSTGQHVWATIGGRGWGTSSSNPRGGAGWHSQRGGGALSHPQGLRAGGTVGVGRRAYQSFADVPEEERVAVPVLYQGIMPGLRAGGLLSTNRTSFRRGGLTEKWTSDPSGVAILDPYIAAMRVQIPALVRKPTGAKVGSALREFAKSIEQIDEDTASIFRQRIRDIRTERAKLRRGGVRRRERNEYRGLAEEAQGLQLRLRQQTDPISYRRLEAMDKNLGRQIARQRRRPGNTNAERVAVRRLEAAQRVVQTEMGRRTQMLVTGVTKQSEAIERGRNAISRTLRAVGIDEATSAGSRAMAAYTATQITQLRSMERRLSQALTRARRAKDTAAVNDLTTQLTEMREQIAEAGVTWIEQVRGAILAGAQEQVDTASFGQQVSDLWYQSLELQQRLNKTYETSAGQIQRRDYINQVLLPEVAKQIAAAQNQVAIAAQVAGEGSEAWRQAVLELLGKQNDYAQLQVNAEEQTAENTEPLKELHTALAFAGLGGQTTTDLIGAGTGA